MTKKSKINHFQKLMCSRFNPIMPYNMH